MSNVLITAGAAGIGRGMAAAFAERGDAVWVVDINEANLVACPGSWRQDYLDVTDESAVSDFFQRLRSQWDTLDVLCANAGVAGPIGPG